MSGLFHMDGVWDKTWLFYEIFTRLLYLLTQPRFDCVTKEHKKVPMVKDGKIMKDEVKII